MGATSRGEIPEVITLYGALEVGQVWHNPGGTK